MHSDTWYTLYITLRMHGSVIYAYTQNDGVRISKILLDVPRRSITYPYMGTVHSPPYFITRGPVSSRRDVFRYGQIFSKGRNRISTRSSPWLFWHPANNPHCNNIASVCKLQNHRVNFFSRSIYHENSEENVGFMDSR